MSDEPRYTIECTFLQLVAIVNRRDVLPDDIVDQAVSAISVHMMNVERSVARLKAEVDALKKSQVVLFKDPASE